MARPDGFRVLMTYAERGSIRRVIEGFFDTGVVDEVVVVNNYAEEGTASSVTGNPLKAFVLGLRMILLVLGFRLNAPRPLPRPGALEGVSMLSSGRKK